MTAPRYIGLAGPVADRSRDWISRVVQAARTAGLNLVFQTDHLIVLSNTATTALTTTGQLGVAVGTVFDRGGSSRAPYRKAPTVHLPGLAGEDIMRVYWGGYVAFIVDDSEDAVHVLRDPSGSLDCYRSREDGVDVVYSDLSVATELGLVKGEPDPNAVLHHLAYASLRTERTCLFDVNEVLPGTSVRLGAGRAPTVRSIWTPWTFAAKPAQLVDPAEARAVVRLETQRCVSAWADQYPHIHHELSGGLDSSIIAACLADRTKTLTCMTYLTPENGADERAYAQEVADWIGAPLEAVTLSLNDSDLGDMASELTARPGSGILHQVLNRSLTREADRTGVPVFFSGGGGDNVFCYIKTAAPAVDALRRFGLGVVFLNSLGDLAALHGCTSWHAAHLTLRKLFRPLRGLPRNVDFLAPGAAPSGPEPHPWLKAPPGAQHGSHEHILWLTAAQAPLSSQAHHGEAPICYPLLSQPVVEACLRVPSWMWIAGGRNRAMARDAFAAALPPAILQRRTKGDFTGLLGALYQKHRVELDDLLLEGWLASRGLLDRAAIAAYLRSDRPTTDYRFCRLMEIASAEVWARSWLGSTASTVFPRT